MSVAGPAWSGDTGQASWIGERLAPGRPATSPAAGPAGLISALLADPRIEALPAAPDDPLAG
jgi:hypothetical protein